MCDIIGKLFEVYVKANYPTIPFKSELVINTKIPTKSSIINRYELVYGGVCIVHTMIT